MSKNVIKKSSNQEVRGPEILIDVVLKSLEEKNQNSFEDQKSSVSQSTLKVSANSSCEVVDKSLVEAAFFNLKKTINQDFLFHLNFKILLKIFKGLIAKQILEKFFIQQSSEKPVDLVGSSGFGLKFDALLVEDKNHIVLDLATQPPKDRVFIIRKNKWDYLKRECEKNTGRLPDYLFFIQIFRNNNSGLLRDFESRDLEKNLSFLEDWVLNYSGNFSAKIVGWVSGVDVEKLNDSSKLQPEGVTLRKPAFWCYVTDPWLKPMSDFLIKEDQTE